MRVLLIVVILPRRGNCAITRRVRERPCFLTQVRDFPECLGWALAPGPFLPAGSAPLSRVGYYSALRFGFAVGITQRSRGPTRRAARLRFDDAHRSTLA